MTHFCLIVIQAETLRQISFLLILGYYIIFWLSSLKLVDLNNGHQLYCGA